MAGRARSQRPSASAARATEGRRRSSPRWTGLAPTSGSSPPTAGSCPTPSCACRGWASSTCTRRCCRVTAARRPSSAPSWPARRRPASRSCGSSPSSTPGLSFATEAVPIGRRRDQRGPGAAPGRGWRVGAAARGGRDRARRGGRDPAGRSAGHLRATAHEGRRRHRLGTARRGHPQPGARRCTRGRTPGQPARAPGTSSSSQPSRPERPARRCPAGGEHRPGQVLVASGSSLVVAAGSGAVAPHPPDPARGAAPDGGARVPRRPSAGARHRSWVQDRCRRPPRGSPPSTRSGGQCRRDRSAPGARGDPARASRTIATERLAAEILTGTLRWRGALDFLIERYAARPLSSDSTPRSSTSCASSGYQLLHLDRVPAAAVVNDAVELTRRAAKASAAGFVNAVLRAVLPRPGTSAAAPAPVRRTRRRARPAAAGRSSTTWR